MHCQQSSPQQLPIAEPATTPTIFIVDDDVSVRESLEALIRRAGWHPITFPSSRAFLAHPQVTGPSCVILDVDLPDISGLDLQEQMSGGYHPPIIFLTGQGDIRTSVRAIKAGALDFLTKPFRSAGLLQLVRAALELDFESRSKRAELDNL